jgi:hypothetical protein
LSPGNYQMNNQCIDPEIGILLHAYELKLLDEENATRFEMHLLKCRYCFEEVQLFSEESDILHADNKIKKLTAKEASPGFVKRLWRYLWPETPIIFRPAVGILTILLIAVPAWFVFHGTGEKQVRPIYTIALVPLRSAPESEYKLSSGADVLLNFVYENAAPQKKYRIVIMDKSGQEFYRNDSFTGFDKYGAGQLLVTRNSLKAGIYHMIIEDPQDSSNLNRQEYYIPIMP